MGAVEEETVVSTDEQLGELRRMIDGIDAEMAALWGQRLQVAAQIGGIKREAGLPVYSHERELAVRDGFGALCEEVGVPRAVGMEVMGMIIASSRKVQR